MMKTIKVNYGGFETEQIVEECVYNAIYNKALTDLFNTKVDNRGTLTDAYNIKPCGDLDEGWNDCFEDFRDLAEQLKNGWNK